MAGAAALRARRILRDEVSLRTRAQDSAQELTEQLTALRAEAQAVANARDDLARELHCARGAVQNTEAGWELCSAGWELAVASREDSRNAADDELNEVKSRLSEANARVQELDAELEEKSALAEAARARLAEQTTLAESSAARVKELEALVEATAATLKESEALSEATAARIAELEADLAASKDELAQVSAGLEGSDNVLAAQLAAAMARAEASERDAVEVGAVARERGDQLEEAQDALCAAKVELASLQSAASARRDLERRCTALELEKAQLERQQSKVESARADLSAAFAKIGARSQQVIDERTRKAINEVKGL